MWFLQDGGFRLRSRAFRSRASLLAASGAEKRRTAALYSNGSIELMATWRPPVSLGVLVGPPKVPLHAPISTQTDSIPTYLTCPREAGAGTWLLVYSVKKRRAVVCWCKSCFAGRLGWKVFFFFLLFVVCMLFATSPGDFTQYFFFCCCNKWLPNHWRVSIFITN